jgi:signal transduction histidine kinase
MTQQSDRALSLACVADQSVTATVLHDAILAAFPAATVARVDTDIERVLPDAIDCAVIAATVNGSAGTDVLRRLRARGYEGAAVLLVDANGGKPSAADEASIARLGARTCLANGELVMPLATAIADALQLVPTTQSAVLSSALRSLRQTQRLLAAGELAMRLQHSLNNPLAALLAEAQLLELEELSPDHRASVERIIEVARRVIEVVRGLDGVGRA